jgi:hypothetical protein
MKNLAEVQLSRSSFDALTGGRVVDRVNGKSEAFDRAGGLSGRLPDTQQTSRASRFQRRGTRNVVHNQNTQKDFTAEHLTGPLLHIELRSTGQAEACPT